MKLVLNLGRPALQLVRAPQKTFFYIPKTLQFGSSENILVLNGDDNLEDEWETEDVGFQPDSDKPPLQTSVTNFNQITNLEEDNNEDQNTYDIERPRSPAGSDMTDVSLPMNVSDHEEDPPTVIHRPPPAAQSPPQKHFQSGSPQRNPIMQNQTKKITLDMSQTLLQGSPKVIMQTIQIKMKIIEFHYRALVYLEVE